MFSPSKSQRKLVNRWNRFVLQCEGKWNSSDSNTKSHKNTKTPQKSVPFSFPLSIHESESAFISGDGSTYAFEIILEPACYSAEKFALYQKYQKDIHNDHRNSISAFTAFLVDTPLIEEPIPYTSDPPKHLPTSYGSYHQLYRLDGELIAMAVLDILPNCVSSVYFMYDSIWQRFSLGKLSALRETSLVREMHEHGAPCMSSLYMGFYVHSCQKMRYKGEYSPSYLLDPEEYTWHPLKICSPILDKYRYACFSHPENSTDEQEPGEVPDPEVPQSVLAGLHMIESIQDGEASVMLFHRTPWWTRRNRQQMSYFITALGYEISKELIFDYNF